MKNPSERRLLKIYVEKSDLWKGFPLYQAIAETARTQDVAGATIYAAGIFGYGCKSQAGREVVPSLPMNSPVVIEIVDHPEKIEALIVKLKPMVGIEGLMTLSRVDIV